MDEPDFALAFREFLRVVARGKCVQHLTLIAFSYPSDFDAARALARGATPCSDPVTATIRARVSAPRRRATSGSEHFAVYIHRAATSQADAAHLLNCYRELRSPGGARASPPHARRGNYFRV